MMSSSLLSIEHLQVSYRAGDRTIQAIRDANLFIEPGEAVGLVGESGSGKTTLGRVILGLLPEKVGFIHGGRIAIAGRDVTNFSQAQWEGLRGQPVAMVFQDPLSFLNPVMRIGKQIAESVRRHDPQAHVGKRVDELLEMVRLPVHCRKSYPHELSGGMRQRVLLAIALGCRPDLLVADEPTTALDVTTQAEILDLIRETQQRLKMSLLLISHDLAVISSMCQKVFVMYAGATVEWGPADRVFSDPRHPYTLALLRSANVARNAQGRFITIEGEIPNLANEIAGCAFASRCPYVFDACRSAMPPIATDDPSSAHFHRCLLDRASLSGEREP